MGHFAGAHIKTRAVPRTLDFCSAYTAFGKRTKAVRAELLERVNPFLNAQNANNHPIDLGADRFSGLQIALTRNRDITDLTFARRRRSDADRVLWRRCLAPMPSYSDPVLVDETPAQIPGDAQDHKAAY